MWKSIVLALVCSACAAQPSVDQSQNAYPPECRGDLSGISAVIIRADLGRDANGRKRLGWWMPGIAVDTIMIDSGLSGWRYDDAVTHERCHSRMNALHPETGGKWHD